MVKLLLRTLSFSVFAFADDLTGANETLDKVRHNLEALKSSTSSTNSLANRTRALLHHLHHRLQIIVRPSKVEDATLPDKVQESFQRNLNRFSALELISSSAPHASAAESAPNATAVADGLDIERLNVNVTCDRGVTSQLSKLRYDGKICVCAFIQRLVEFKISRGLSDDRMLSSATDLFTGDALHWFRAIKPKINDWRVLLVCLKEDFDVPDFDYKMAAEIRSRTQGETDCLVV